MVTVMLLLAIPVTLLVLLIRGVLAMTERQQTFEQSHASYVAAWCDNVDLPLDERHRVAEKAASRQETPS